MMCAYFVVKTEPMSSSEIASTAADGSLDSFSGSGKERILDFPIRTKHCVSYFIIWVYVFM